MKLTQGLLAPHKIKPLQRNVTTPLQFKKINYRDIELERVHLPPLSPAAFYTPTKGVY